MRSRKQAWPHLAGQSTFRIILVCSAFGLSLPSISASESADLSSKSSATRSAGPSPLLPSTSASPPVQDAAAVPQLSETKPNSEHVIVESSSLPEAFPEVQTKVPAFIESKPSVAAEDASAHLQLSLGPASIQPSASSGADIEKSAATVDNVAAGTAEPAIDTTSDKPTAAVSDDNICNNDKDKPIVNKEAVTATKEEDGDSDSPPATAETVAEIEPAALLIDDLTAELKDDEAPKSSLVVSSAAVKGAEPTLPAGAQATVPSIQATVQEAVPMPTSFSPEDLDGTAAEYVEWDDHQASISSEYDPKFMGPQSIHTVVPTKSLQAIEITSASYDRINPNRIGLIEETQDDADHFLANKASQLPKAGGPLNNNGRSEDDDLKKSGRREDSGEEELRKGARNNDRDENSPGINDILSGLLSVVGEGLNFATNYVQENNKRKKEEQEKEKIKPASELVNGPEEGLFPSRNRTRINNRGPPRISEIPFEAIPLEGIKPGLIPQRPFGTRFPGSPLRPPLSPLQQEPSSSSAQPADGEDKNITLPDQLPTRPGYEPFQSLDGPTTTLEEEEGGGTETETEPVEGNTEQQQRVSPGTTPGTPPDKANQLINQFFKDTAAGPPPQRRPTPPALQRPVPPGRPGAELPQRPESLGPEPPPSSSTLSLLEQIFGTTTTQQTIDIEPSFEPPVLVTPPPPQRRPFVQRPRQPPPLQGRPGFVGPQQRPGGGSGGRPPLPPLLLPVPPGGQPPSAYPTPPLTTTTRPLVFPSRAPPSPPAISEAPVENTGLFQEPEVVTGFAIPADNDVFDLTVTAQQNFGGTRPTKKYNDFGIITKPRPGDQFVSIDGKKTYFEIGPTAAPELGPPAAAAPPPPPPPPRPAASKPLPGRGEIIGATLQIGGQDIRGSSRASASPPDPTTSSDTTEGSRKKTTSPSKVGPTRRPEAPPVRIDTCIVGDDNTCKANHHEVCRTYLGVSSCYCKPGYGRKNHRLLCKKTVRLLMSLKVDRLQDERLRWNTSYQNPNSEMYQVLEGEVAYAMDSAMALTSFSNLYVGNELNKFYSTNGGVTVNMTLEMEENSYTKSELLKRDVQKKLVEVIQARASNIGNGNLYVATLLNPIPLVDDFNECSEPEYNDCGENSECINTFGGFSCQCIKGYEDADADNPQLAGRHCSACPDDYCSGKGTCTIQEGERLCQCTGNYYGPQCQVDGEVLAVAVGASVAAVVIIILTLICLCMWSRRWKRDQQKNEISRPYSRPYLVGTLPPPPSYKAGPWPPSQPSPAYPRPPPSNMGWTHHIDSQNIYALPQPARRAGMVGGRSNLPALPRPSTALGTRNNPPLIETSESEDTDNTARLQRPRSSSSMMGGNLNVEDDFESEYLRYGGTVGVRNPRLVAAMRGVPPYQQQHIQMNMLARY